jgi:methylmalonyl-CoA mutase, N-terminal domain
VGVAIDTLGDVEILFDGLPFDRISTSFTITATAAIGLAFYIAALLADGNVARAAPALEGAP